MTQYTRNILKVFAQCTGAELQHGMRWYKDAEIAGQNIADKYQLPLHIVVGVIAALSPTNEYNIDDVAFILNGPKITDFAYCSMGEDVCVIDGHAWCIANNDRRTMQKVPNIGKKLRAELQECYRRAGKKHGMTAYQMQASTWVAWKRIHNV